MKPTATISLLLLLLFLLLLGQPSATVSTKCIITKTCKGISKSDPNIHHNSCKAALTTAAAFHAVLTLTDLYFISVEAAVSEANSTRAHFKNLLKLSRNNRVAAADDKQVTSCLKVCKKVFSDAVDFLRFSRKAVEKGELEDAKTWTSGVLSGVTTCDDCFEEVGVANPLKKNGRDMFEISAITLAILSLL